MRPYYSIQTRWQLLRLSSILSSNILETLVVMQLHYCLERNCLFDISDVVNSTFYSEFVLFLFFFSLSVHTLYWPLYHTDDLRLTSFFVWLAIIGRVFQCELGPAQFLPGGFILTKDYFCAHVAWWLPLEHFEVIYCSRCCINKAILCQTGLNRNTPGGQLKAGIHSNINRSSLWSLLVDLYGLLTPDSTLMPRHKLLHSSVHMFVWMTWLHCYKSGGQNTQPKQVTQNATLSVK